jgi:hypothetical protein
VVYKIDSDPQQGCAGSILNCFPGRRELNHHWVVTIPLRHGAAYKYVAGPEHFTRIRKRFRWRTRAGSGAGFTRIVSGSAWNALFTRIVWYKVESRKSAILATHKKSASSNRTQSNYKNWPMLLINCRIFTWSFTERSEWTNARKHFYICISV